MGSRKLIELLNDSEAVFARTGCYAGIAELSLKQQDPLKFERFHSRLLSMIISVRDTMKFVASSPAVREFEEFVIGLYTPEGDAVALSTGIMVHVHTLSEFIKFMIRNDYEGDPRIRPGDIFENNELWGGGVHTPDVMTVIPMFEGEELIGWVGSVTHELETGSYEGPGVSAFVPDRYGEGLHISCEKVGENDEFRRDYLIRLNMNLRNASWWIMDDKAKLSGCIMVREAVRKIIAEFGLDYYNRAIRELIEEGRRNFLKRVRTTLVPGTFRALAMPVTRRSHLSFAHPLAANDCIDLVETEMRVTRKGTIELDFDGSSSWSFHPFNCGPGPMNGGLWITLTQMLAYDGRVNDGAYLAVKQHLPEGSIVNTDFKGAASSLSWWTLIPAFSNIWRLISTGWYARGFLEEIIMSTPTCTVGVTGFDQFGQSTGYQNFEMSAESFGSRAVADGADCGSAIWNSEGMQGDAEIWEMTGPNLYLGRRFVRNHQGFGRFRGGQGWESLWMVHGSDVVNVTLTGSGCTSGGVFHKGMFGGYPPPGWKCFYAAGTDLKDRIADGAAVPAGIDRAAQMISEGALSARDWYVGGLTQWSPNLKQGDLFGILYYGGCGYGDPLQRAPELVAADIEKGFIDRATAERVYGVGANPQDAQSLRDAIRARRLAESVPASEWWERERERARSGEVHQLVRSMYARSHRLSPSLKERYLNFWKIEEFPYADAEPPLRYARPTGFVLPQSTSGRGRSE